MLDDGSGSETALIVASTYDVVALCVATGLSDYKPGHARRARRRDHETVAAT